MAPLHHAAAGGHLGCANLLLQRGSEVDVQGEDVSPPPGIGLGLGSRLRLGLGLD